MNTKYSTAYGGIEGEDIKKGRIAAIARLFSEVAENDDLLGRRLVELADTDHSCGRFIIHDLELTVKDAQ